MEPADETTDRLAPPERLRLADGRAVLLRDLWPADAALYPAFDAGVTLEDRRLRFFGALARMSPSQIRSLTQYDRGQAVAIIAVDEGTGAMLGVSRLHRLAGHEGEFAVLVRSDLNGQGLGHALMRAVMARAAALGVSTITGLVLQENRRMLDFCRDLGFSLERVPQEPSLVAARLAAPAGRAIAG